VLAGADALISIPVLKTDLPLHDVYAGVELD
jgi:hypothetical protein